MSPIPVRSLKNRKARGVPRPGTHGERILGFLRRHSSHGFRAVELSEKTGIEIHTLGSVLRRLHNRGLIDVIDEHWFALSDEDVAKRQAHLWTNRHANERLEKENAKDWPRLDEE